MTRGMPVLVHPRAHRGVERVKTRASRARGAVRRRRCRPGRGNDRKAELIRGPARSKPRETVEDVGLTTLSWVDRHNQAACTAISPKVPPAGFEETFYATKRTDQPLVLNQMARASSAHEAIHPPERAGREGMVYGDE